MVNLGSDSTNGPKCGGYSDAITHTLNLPGIDTEQVVVWVKAWARERPICGCL